MFASRRMGGLILPLTVLALGLSSAWANANTTIKVTPGGATDTAGDAVNAQATFVTGSGTVTVTLQNLQPGMKDAGQLLSDIFFTLSGGETGGSVTSSSGVERTVNSDKTYTEGSSASAGWGYSNSSGTIHLDGLNGTDTPAHTIIGPASGDNKYDNANASLAGNGPHNPFLGGGNGTVTFNLSVSGVTASDTITAATFSFGTASGDNVTGVDPVPEFGSAVLMSLVLGGFIGLYALQRVRRPAKAMARA